MQHRPSYPGELLDPYVQRPVLKGLGHVSGSNPLGTSKISDRPGDSKGAAYDSGDEAVPLGGRCEELLPCSIKSGETADLVIGHQSIAMATAAGLAGARCRNPAGDCSRGLARGVAEVLRSCRQDLDLEVEAIEKEVVVQPL